MGMELKWAFLRDTSFRKITSLPTSIKMLGQLGQTGAGRNPCLQPTLDRQSMKHPKEYWAPRPKSTQNHPSGHGGHVPGSTLGLGGLSWTFHLSTGLTTLRATNQWAHGSWVVGSRWEENGCWHEAMGPWLQ